MTSSRVGRILLDRERAARMANEGSPTIPGEGLRSAFTISNEHVLTARHCVQDAAERGDRLWFRLRDADAQTDSRYKYVPVTLLDSDEKFDVAVLVVDRSRLSEAGLSESGTEKLLAGSIIPLGKDVSVHDQVRVMGFPTNAPSADSDTLSARVVDLALPLGDVTGLKLVSTSFAAVDPVDPRGLSGGPVLKPNDMGDGGIGVEVAVGVVRQVPVGRYPDTALGGELIATRIEDVAPRLPQVAAVLPRTAHLREIVAYLTTLIDWYNTDPWPRDRRFDGPILTPAVIERKLRVTATDRAGEQDLDADELAQQCGRLVVLGGAGSGKTWLAKRTVRRCAEGALKALAEGRSLDEVELPLYTTCSRLFCTDGDIRKAAVFSALDQLGDVGSSRVSTVLRAFFTERSAPTLLVIDSLDEAHGSDERLRQADTLPWRIVLTSRPSSWNNQLVLEAGNDSHRVGELQPLRYPDDVEPFIQRWFGDRPEWGNDLAAQIARRPDLQQAATVPLILAFYCIVGGGIPLPDLRRDLYPRVLNRLLTGRWRGSDDRQSDTETCLQTLRAWAWSGATSDPVSGVGTWADDIRTERVRLGEADENAVNHVATPFGPPDVDTGKTLRRFIHRSIREQLVAEHVARLPLDQAVEALLPHLWYDPNWEYAAPAALAMHRQRDALLRNLIRRAAGSAKIPKDLFVIDAGREFRQLFARVATESSEADWSPEIAGVIAQARVELARSAHIDDLGHSASWQTSNRQARDALLGLLRSNNYWRAGKLVDGVVRLATTAEDKRQARDALLGLLACETDGRVASELVGGVARLVPTAKDKLQARDWLLGLLDQLKTSRRGPLPQVTMLVGAVAQLDPTAEDKRQARDALLGLLARETDGRVASELAGAVAQLDPPAEHKRQARDALLGLIAREANNWVVGKLVGGVVRLATTAEDKRQARDALLGLLAGETDGRVASELAGAVAQLDPPAEHKPQARDALLQLFAHTTDGEVAVKLVGAVAQLDPTTEDKRQARDRLLRMLAQLRTSRRDPLPQAAMLAGGMAQLGPTAEDKRQARDALLQLLAHTTNRAHIVRLVNGVARLATTAGDKRQARDALLQLLARETYHLVAGELVGGVARLVTTAEDKRQAREALLGLLARETDGRVASELAGGVARLCPTAEDKRQARNRLVGMLARLEDERFWWQATMLVGGVAQLDPTAEDKYQARDALLRLLLRTTDVGGAGALAGVVARLQPTTEDKRRARDWLVRLLQYDPYWRWPEDEPTDHQSQCRRLVGEMVHLNPTVGDLTTWRGPARPDPGVRAWPVAPTVELLAAVRQNSPLAAWLAALPSLASLSR